MSVSENPTLHINSVGRAVRPKTRRGTQWYWGFRLGPMPQRFLHKFALLNGPLPTSRNWKNIHKISVCNFCSQDAPC
jgi:hypothetical protein